MNAPAGLADDIKFLLRQLFTAYCTASNIGIYKRTEVSPIHFINWMERHLADQADQAGYAAPGELEALTASPDHRVIAPEAVAYVRSIPHRYNGLMGLMAFWPYLALEYRETAHPVRAVSTGVIIHYEDGTVVNLMRFIRSGVLSRIDISEADVVSMIYGRGQELAGEVQQTGLDRLHDRAGNRGACEGDVLAYIHAVLAQAPHSPGMTEKLQLFLGLLPSIFVGMIDPAALRKLCGLPEDPVGDARLRGRAEAALRGGESQAKEGGE